MAIYGAPSAGVALTATTGNDTIGMFGPITATPSISAASVIADGGNDLLNFGVQGVTATAQAPGAVAFPVTAEVFRLVSLVRTPSTPTKVGQWCYWHDCDGYRCDDLLPALRKLVSSQIYANAGNDTLLLV